MYILMTYYPQLLIPVHKKVLIIHSIFEKSRDSI